MHPILELMMEYRLKHCQVSAKRKKRPIGPAGPARPAVPPKPPKKPRTNAIKLPKPISLPKPILLRRSEISKRVPNRDSPKTRQIQKNLMKIAQRAEAYKKYLLTINENTEINESR